MQEVPRLRARSSTRVFCSSFHNIIIYDYLTGTYKYFYHGYNVNLGILLRIKPLKLLKQRVTYAFIVIYHLHTVLAVKILIFQLNRPIHRFSAR